MTLEELANQSSPKTGPAATLAMEVFAHAVAEKIESGASDGFEHAINQGWNVFRQWMTRDYVDFFSRVYKILPDEYKKRLKGPNIVDNVVGTSEVSWINQYLAQRGIENIPTWLVTHKRVAFSKFRSLVIQAMKEILSVPAPVKSSQVPTQQQEPQQQEPQTQLASWIRMNCRFS